MHVVYSLDMLDRGMVHFWGRGETLRFPHTTQNGIQLKTYELFLFGNVYVIFQAMVDC